MDLFHKADKIVMTSLFVLYNTNPMPLVICVPPPLKEPKQQGLDVEEKQHVFLQEGRKRGRKLW
jgi:hypothetical protein